MNDCLEEHNHEWEKKKDSHGNEVFVCSVCGLAMHVVREKTNDKADR